jgi:hypothetical protein
MTTTERSLDAAAGLKSLTWVVIHALGGAYRLKEGPGDVVALLRTEIQEADGSPVCNLELDTKGFPLAKVRYQQAGAYVGASKGWREFKAQWQGGVWTWNADLFRTRVDEQREAAWVAREHAAAHAKANNARRTWLDATAERLRGMLDAKDRVGVDRGEGLTVTLNATDDPDPQEWPTGDVLDLPVMWNEHGVPVALGMQTRHTSGASVNATAFDLPTLARALRYVVQVQMFVAEAADAR